MFQTGDFVWGEIKGRQVPLTTRTIKDGEIKTFLSIAFAARSSASSKAGNDADRPYRFVIERDTSRYRVNIAGAQIGDAEDGLSITMRTIPEIPPQLHSLNLPSSILENLFSTARVGLDLRADRFRENDTHVVVLCVRVRDDGRRKDSALRRSDRVSLYQGEEPRAENPANADRSPHREFCPRHSQRHALQADVDWHRRGTGRGNNWRDGGGSADRTRGLRDDAYGKRFGTIARAYQSFPGEQHSAMASKILGTLRLIVVQILVPTLDGERHAVREWLYFDRDIKRAMSEMHYTEWGAYLRKLVADKKQDMAAGLKDLLDRGLIDEKAFRRYAGRPTNENASLYLARRVAHAAHPGH